MENLSKKILILGAALCMLNFSGCSEKENLDQDKGISISKGAIIGKEKESIYNLELEDGKYKKSDLNEAVLEHANKSSIVIEQGKHYIYHNGEKINIEDSSYDALNLSQDGKYLGYMTYDEGYNLKIKNLEKNENITINSKVSISGKYFDFAPNNKLVYYGISEDGENGVFSYDLETRKEKLLYKVQAGYIEFLKSNNDEIIIFQQISDTEKILKSINLKDEKITILSKDINNIYDILKKDNTYFFLGSTKRDGDSLYELKDGNAERIVFDFPYKVNIKKGLSINENNEVLFIGKALDSINEDIYSYNQDGDIKLVTDRDGNYEFVKND